jgi:hypothetical protein
MTRNDNVRLRRVLRKLSESNNAKGKIRQSLPVVTGRKESVARTLEGAKAVNPRRKRLWQISDHEEPLRSVRNDTD